MHISCNSGHFVAGGLLREATVFITIIIKWFFSTSHVIPHIRALVPCPGLTSEACIVASTSVPLTPTEILNFVFLHIGYSYLIDTYKNLFASIWLSR